MEDKNYIFLETYKGTHTKIKVKHNECNRTYQVRPNSFFRGDRCPYCSVKKRGIAQRKTHDFFKKEVFDLVGEEYNVLSNYVKSNMKVKFKHELCGNIYETTPQAFLQGSRCPECAKIENTKNKTWSNEYFKRKVKDVVGNEYDVLGEYIKNNVNVKFKHNTCGNLFDMRPSSFLSSGQRCPSCGIEKRASKQRKSIKQFKEEVFQLVENEFSVLGQYKNNSTPILMSHNECGYEWRVAPKDFLYKDVRCPKCYYLSKKKTDEEFKIEVFEQVSDRYSFLEEYRGKQEKLFVEHNKCGYKYKVTPDSFLQGSRCPSCSRKGLSKNAKKIYDFLKEKKVNFDTEYWFDDLRGKKNSPLRFDFVVFNSDDELIKLIGYHGKQHYEPIEHFGGEKQFKKQQKYDQMKRDYCETNEYKFLEIPYWEKNNIEKILKKEKFVVN